MGIGYPIGNKIAKEILHFFLLFKQIRGLVETHVYAGPFVTTNPRDMDDYIRAEYRQIAIMVGSTTIGRVGILSV